MIGLLRARFIAALVVLLSLIALQLVAPNLLILVMAIALVVLPVVHWASVWFFGKRAVENPEVRALKPRTQDAFALALAQTAGAVLGALLLLRAIDFIPMVDRGVFIVGLSFALLMIAEPALNWLATWTPWRQP